MSETFDFGSLKKKTPIKAKKDKPKKQVKSKPVKAVSIVRAPKTPKIEKLDFNSFMAKLEKSNSYASQHLKEKINVKGKHKAINKERVIRIIRDVLDIANE